MDYKYFDNGCFNEDQTNAYHVLDTAIYAYF